mmetsp:Transcript_21308/g.46526  ORF Transcript_21308/g.46526 Transcript_21308/m.46526 type:complete len:256 (+) Transcript_21308:95-862(+)
MVIMNELVSSLVIIHVCAVLLFACLSVLRARMYMFSLSFLFLVLYRTSLCLFLVQIHPCHCLSTNVFDNLVGGIGVAGHHGRLTHGLQECRVLEPRRDALSNLGGSFLVFSKVLFQYNVNVARFLAGEETRHQDRQTHRRRFRNRSRPGLGHQDIGRHHVFGNVGQEPQRQDSDAAPRWGGRFGRRGGVSCLDAVFPPHLAQQPPDSPGALPGPGGNGRRFRVEIPGQQLVPEFFVAAADDADGGVDALAAEFGV